MSAGNQKGASPEGGEGTGNLPTLQPERRETGALPEVVWSSPITTGSSLAGMLGQKTEAAPAPDDAPEWAQRHIFAFESDLLDHAFVHWDADELTLEMIPGFKKDAMPESANTYPAETVASGLGTLVNDSVDGPITRVDMSLGGAMARDGAKPFQPDVTGGLPGPMRVREDGIEDPVTGWKPTGMVFFETLATPPRGTVYSSSLLQAFAGPFSPPGSEKAFQDAAENESGMGAATPFFDFPENIASPPPEETEEFQLREVIVKGAGGGGHILRLLGRLVLMLLAVVGIAFMALAGSYSWYVWQRLYDSKSSDRVTTVTVRPGESFRSVIDGMHKNGLLKGFMGLDDRYLMRYLAYAYQTSHKMKPGVYQIPTGQNLQDVYSNLIAGSKDFKITIPEGKTAQEIGKLVAGQYKNFNAETFTKLTQDSEFTKSLGVDAPTLEGYLYPSTYYFGPGMKEEELVRLMVGTFQSKVQSELGDKMTSSGLSFHEHVIMASLIEREARLDADRPLIASVIFNRLNQNMPLQIDATVNYALNEWRVLNNSDYLTDHPFNTYKMKGLPPGPITTPRIESLAATFHAPKTDYLYYVHKGNGYHAFAATYPQHLANVGRYIREKHSPGMGNIPAAGESPVADAAAGGEKQPELAGSGPEVAEPGSIEITPAATSDPPVLEDAAAAPKAY